MTGAISRVIAIAPLYMIASLREVELKRAMHDLGSSLIIISLSVLDVVGVPRGKAANRGVSVWR